MPHFGHVIVLAIFGVLTDVVNDFLAMRSRSGIGRRVASMVVGADVDSMVVGADVHTDIDPGDPVNMRPLLAFEWVQAAPQSFLLNDSASRNMLSMLITLDTSHFEMSRLKNVASENIRLMSVTLDTSHFEMSPVKDTAPRNMSLMSVTRDTSHSPIG